MLTLQEILSKRTVAEEVHVSFSKVAALLGEAKAEELAISKVGVGERRAVSPRSAIKASKRVEANDYARFNRLELLEAIEGNPEETEENQTSSPEKWTP